MDDEKHMMHNAPHLAESHTLMHDNPWIPAKCFANPVSEAQ